MAIGVTDDKHFQDIADAIRQKNGSTETYKPNEMADAIKELNCPFDLLKYGIGQEQSDKLNTMFQNQIEENFNLFESKRTALSWNQIAIRNKNVFYIPFVTECTSCAEGFYESGLKTLDNFNFKNITGSCNACFVGCNLDRLPEEINFIKCTNLVNLFQNTKFEYVPEIFTLNLGYKSDTNSSVSLNQVLWLAKKVNGTIKKVYITGDRLNNLSAFTYGTFLQGCEEFVCMDSINITTLNNLFYSSSVATYAPKKIKFGSLENCTSFGNWLNNTYDVEVVEFDNWKKTSLTLFNGKGNNINGESTQYIIEHAMSPEYDEEGNVTNGVVARTLTLQSKAKANFEALPNCEELKTLATQKLITIA